MSPSNRREFLAQSLRAMAFVPVLPCMPGIFMHREGMTANIGEGGYGDRILIVIQLSGGNDGLNTVVPYADDAYHNARPVLRVRESDVHRLDDHLGLHPSMKELKNLYDEGSVCIVQGVGYPNPNRSHFTSMDIWQTASLEENLPETGWLGRAVDEIAESSEDSGALTPAWHLGGLDLPRSLWAEKATIPAVPSLDDVKRRWVAEFKDRNRAVEAHNRLLNAKRSGGQERLEFISKVARSAYAGSDRLESIGLDSKPSLGWPNTPLAKSLFGVSQLIRSGFGARIYHVELTGFDTHAAQGKLHAALLQTLSGAIGSFMKSMKDLGLDEKVLLMSLSEFGRRVEENGSHGTDHGAAAPLIMASGALKGGIHGARPDFKNLDDGDLTFTTDFRSVYATCLESWLGLSSKEILGGRHELLPIFA